MSSLARYIEKRHSPARNVASWLMKRLSWHTVGVPQDLKLNSFRLMRRRVADAVVELAGAKPRVGLMIFQVTRRITNVDVEHHARQGEQSSYRPRKLISAAIDNIVNYSSLASALACLWRISDVGHRHHPGDGLFGEIFGW